MSHIVANMGWLYSDHKPMRRILLTDVYPGHHIAHQEGVGTLGYRLVCSDSIGGKVRETLLLKLGWAAVNS